MRIINVNVRSGPVFWWWRRPVFSPKLSVLGLPKCVEELLHFTFYPIEDSFRIIRIEFQIPIGRARFPQVKNLRLHLPECVSEISFPRPKIFYKFACF